jgi:hypothetical protein
MKFPIWKTTSSPCIIVDMNNFSKLLVGSIVILSCIYLLAAIEGYLKSDRYLFAQYRWYVREMRVVAYSQILESYRSLTIESMARSFGVSKDFIDRYVSNCLRNSHTN